MSIALLVLLTLRVLRLTIALTYREFTNNTNSKRYQHQLDDFIYSTIAASLGYIIILT